MTTIVARMTPNEIVVAADSKGSVVSADSTTQLSVCKIASLRKYFFAASGLVKSRDGTVDAYALAFDVSGYTKPLLATVTDFAVRMIDPLRARLEGLRSENSQKFRETLSKEALQTIFFGVENRKLILVALVFSVSLNTNNKVQITAQRFIFDKKCLLVLGESDAAYELEKTSGFWIKGSVNGVRRMVEAAVVAKPENVGPPIDVLRLTRTQTEWIDRRIECKNK
jgi:hypothetical protein